MDSLIGPMQQFIRYRQILTSAADPVLAVAAQGTVPPDSILIGSAAAALLLKDDPDLYPKNFFLDPHPVKKFSGSGSCKIFFLDTILQ